MRCPQCHNEAGLANICPHCGRQISYGGNTTVYVRAASAKLTPRDIMSDVLKRHRPGAMARTLRSDYYTERDMLLNWQKPWLFLRVFAVLGLMTAAFVYAVNNGFFPLFPMLLVLGNLLVPFTILCFIWEMDIPRRVSFVEVLLLVMFGGILSLLPAGHINSSPTLDSMNAAVAALTEEPIKLLVSILFIYVMRKRRFYILDGLMIGAAVACGFAFMESITYTLSSSYLNGGRGLGESTMIMRAIGSLFSGHITYTAPYVAAFCYASNGRQFKLRYLLNPIFLLMLGVGMGMHALNNSGLLSEYYFLIPIGGYKIHFWYLSELIQGGISWYAMFYMIRLGVKQVLHETPERSIIQFEGSPRAQLVCLKGELAGQAFPVYDDQPIVIGRDPSACNIVLGTSKGVSRRHCQLLSANGRFSVVDLGSTYGTLLSGQMKIAPNQRSALSIGDTISVGGNDCVFEVTA